ncbi:MAG: hypothetical protein K8S87_10390, partial [Planctomycetes bacterium]|nr:hypothetical protein [Planctomycetota bacterium]
MQKLKTFAFFMLCFTVLLAVSCKTTDENDTDNAVNIDNVENDKPIANKVRILYTANLDGCIMPGEYKIGNYKEMHYRPGF